MSELDIVDTDTQKWDYLKEYVPGLDYHKVHSDFRSGDNIVGHIQRAVVIYWAIKEHERTGGIGLEPGCGQAISPFCIGTDYYAGNSHPVYGGGYHPHIRSMGEVLPFKNNSFDFIVSHHSLEHMRDTEKTLREWLRVLKMGGRIAIVMPDKNYGPFGDSSHVSEYTPWEFQNVLKRIDNINIIEMDTLNNHFSFDAVIEKSNSTGDIMETQTIEQTNLKTQLRTLWQDRAMWTRMLLINKASGFEGEIANILKRLYKNQEDIADALKPYLEKYLFCWDDIPGSQTVVLTELLNKNFGINWLKSENNVLAEKSNDGKTIKLSEGSNSLLIQLNDEMTKAVMLLNLGGKPFEFKFDARKENGKLNIYMDINESKNMLIAMLKSNITMSKNLINAVKAADISMELDVEEALKDNVISIAGYLFSYNPDWSHKQFETMLIDYVYHLKEETVAHMGKNNDADNAAHNKLLENAMKIADTLVDGFTKQTRSAQGKDTVPV